MSIKKIFVPEGKVLCSNKGGYVYRGPCEVTEVRGLSLKKTFTDGTKWEYITGSSLETLPKLTEPKRPVVKTEVFVGSKEPIKIPKKRKYTKKKVVSDEAVNVKVSTEGSGSSEDNSVHPPTDSGSQE